MRSDYERERQKDVGFYFRKRVLAARTRCLRANLNII